MSSCGGGSPAEIPPVVDVGSREEISLCKWGGLQHGAERLIWELKRDTLDGIEAAVDHKPGGIEVAGTELPDSVLGGRADR